MPNTVDEMRNDPKYAEALELGVDNFVQRTGRMPSKVEMGQFVRYLRNDPVRPVDARGETLPWYMARLTPEEFQWRLGVEAKVTTSLKITCAVLFVLCIWKTTCNHQETVGASKYGAIAP